MSKVDFEYYPHVVNLIWEHIPDSSVYLAGQVSSSWRERALKRAYQHLTIEECDRGWRFWMYTPDAADICAKYFLPFPPSDLSPAFWAVMEKHPTFSVDVAARYTQVLDLEGPTDTLGLDDPPLQLTEMFSALHTTRVHGTGGWGFGATQVFFWHSRDSAEVSIKAPEAECIVLTIRVGQLQQTDMFNRAPNLGTHLRPGSYKAEKVVIVFERHGLQPDLSQDQVTRDIVPYLGQRRAAPSITVVGAESLLIDRSCEAAVALKAAILRQLDAQSPDHGVRLLTHEEYEAHVGSETYQLHSVPNFFQWDRYVNGELHIHA